MLEEQTINYHVLNSFERYTSNVLIRTSKELFTYANCMELSFSTADNLAKQSGANANLVAILMEKGWEQIIATTGVLLAGKAYVPIEPTEMKERIESLLGICDVQLGLFQTQYLHPAVFDGIKRLTVDKKSIYSSEKIVAKVKGNDLAYVIFTSGTTGVPKGVMISHQAVLNTILDVNERFKMHEHDRIFSLSSLSFDLSVYDIFGAILAGASIVIPDDDKLREPGHWADMLVEHQVTIWNSVPALMQMLVDYLEISQEFQADLEKLHSLRLVLLSGDWIPISLPQRIRKLFPNAKVVSLGGATEASIWSILYEVDDVNPSWRSIPYGKPMKNQMFYILDENLNPVTDKSGELCIGGTGVALGYWKDKVNTAAKFIWHPKFGRLYKTGDLGRYTEDGNIEFLGRLDSQVKINGIRVELSAIEAALLKQKYVSKAVVVPISDKHGHKGVNAYVSSDVENSDKQNWHKIQKEISNALVLHWRSVYNSLTEEKVSEPFNTTGWNSSYTNLPIPKFEMEEWIHNTADLILSLKPAHVLDIGCGYGLILQKLVDNVESYYAIDISNKAIEYLNNFAKEKGVINLHLKESAAHQFNLEHQKFDTIILNSVSQYFPSIDYFEDVLAQALKHVHNKGCIFIGDVRNFASINHYYLSLLLKKQQPNLHAKNLQNELYRLATKEDELVIHPEYFLNLPQKYKAITHVEIILKYGKYDNEMNNYRYDVILSINLDERFTDMSEHGMQDTENANFFTIYKQLLKKDKNYYMVRNIKNSRLSRLDEILNVLEAGKPEVSLLNILTNNEGVHSNAIHPYDLYAMAKELGYELRLAPEHPFTGVYYSAIFYKSGLEQPRVKIEAISKQAALFSNPAKVIFHNNLIMELKENIKCLLPKHMLPNAIYYVDKFPINNNGKIDRSCLPFAHGADVKVDQKKYSKLESKVIYIFSKILGSENLNLLDNPCDIGVNSLNSAQLVAEIYKEFKVKVQIQDIQKSRAIREVVERIEANVNNKLETIAF